jgi:antitoxin VapB
MALNIKNPEVVQLATQVARLAHETKTEAVRRALTERRIRLQAGGGKVGRKESLLEYFERYVWPTMPADQLGKTLTREEEDKILGYGPNGY